jgi:hypothetical protein
MQETNKQVNNKIDSPALSLHNLTNKLTTRPGCFSSRPARYDEDCQECHYRNECHTKFNEELFYGPS